VKILSKEDFKMYLIVGLGNPEKDYANTRHNMGFNVINKLSEKYDIEVKKEKFKALFGTGTINGEKVILVKPQTFMNLSGEAVQEFVNFYKIPLENMIIIYDDVDIEPGKIRIRKNGSSGHHNGMKSIIQCLSSEKFPRIRVGIGKPQGNMDMIAHVIGGISEEDKKPLEDGVNLGAEAVIEILKNNIDTAMNKYN
jgi:PTH1 family peptidyl-tRNA hydrolase